MARRASQSTIEQLNADIALQRLVVARCIELREVGDRLLGPCPWCVKATGWWSNLAPPKPLETVSAEFRSHG